MSEGGEAQPPGPWAQVRVWQGVALLLLGLSGGGIAGTRAGGVSKEDMGTVIDAKLAPLQAAFGTLGAEIRNLGKRMDTAEIDYRARTAERYTKTDADKASERTEKRLDKLDAEVDELRKMIRDAEKRAR